MARKNDDWLVWVFLALLVLFGAACISHRAFRSGPVQREELASAALVADNVELVAEEPPLQLDPETDPQFGVGPGLYGRDRVSPEM